MRDCLGAACTPHPPGMLSYALVDGFTWTPRHEAIEGLKRAIAEADGVITDFAFFSDRAIRLTVELDTRALAVLRQALERVHVQLFERSRAELSAARGEGAAAHLVLAMLHVTFANSLQEAENDAIRRSA
jgi:hypothetical protein